MATREEIERCLWLARAADQAISGRAVLVGGSAVNLHTGAYWPTDVDMCAYLDEEDRRALISIGFQHLSGDHFAYEFPGGERWLLEFPEGRVDGEVMTLAFADGDGIDVITLDSLVIDRLTQATDGTGVTFDEAVRLCYAAYEEIDWGWIRDEVSRRERERHLGGLKDAFDRVLARVGSLRNG